MPTTGAMAGGIITGGTIPGGTRTIEHQKKMEEKSIPDIFIFY
jgi:hypothetical protein